MSSTDYLAFEFYQADRSLARSLDVMSFMERKPMTRRQYEAAVQRYRSPKGRRRTHARRKAAELSRVHRRHGLAWVLDVQNWRLREKYADALGVSW